MVKERRTPLLLVFGSHPGRCGHLMLEGDREFFRSNFAPFVERWVSGAGRSALMIHEYNIALPVGRSAHLAHEQKGVRDISANDELAKAQLRLDSMRLSVNSMLERTLGTGRVLENGMEWFDWGCADEVIRINRARPGAITSIIEPLVVEAASLLNRPGSGNPERLEAEKEAVLRAVEICRIRSTALADYIKTLRQSDPQRPIMVTRGFAHKSMEGFFDSSEFDITSASRLLGAPFPSTEAAIRVMGGKGLSDQELEHFARLSIHFGDYYERNMLEHMLDSIEGGVFDERKFALLSHRAMEHALRMSGS